MGVAGQIQGGFRKTLESSIIPTNSVGDTPFFEPYGQVSLKMRMRTGGAGGKYRPERAWLYEGGPLFLGYHGIACYTESHAPPTFTREHCHREQYLRIPRPHVHVWTIIKSRLMLDPQRTLTVTHSVGVRGGGGSALTSKGRGTRGGVKVHRRVNDGMERDGGINAGSTLWPTCNRSYVPPVPTPVESAHGPLSTTSAVPPSSPTSAASPLPDGSGARDVKMRCDLPASCRRLLTRSIHSALHA